MSDEEQILEELKDISGRLEGIEQALTGAFGKRGLVGDIVDHEKRITAFEHERERLKGMMFVIGSIAGVVGTLAVTIVKMLFT